MECILKLYLTKKIDNLSTLNLFKPEPKGGKYSDTMITSTHWIANHKRSPSDDSVLSEIWNDCYDELSTGGNSILDSPAPQVKAEDHVRSLKKSTPISVADTKRSSRMRKSRRGTGSVAKTVLGPASVFLGGRQEWSKMKSYVKGLAAADEASRMLVHNSEFV